MRAILPALLLAVGVVSAQDPNDCDLPGERPDLLLGTLTSGGSYGSVDGVAAFSFGTDSCNVGDCWLDWAASTPDHPVFGQNMYRLLDGRFEQIGQSWLTHRFFPLAGVTCSASCTTGDGTHLGTGCSSPDTASINGYQDRMGPRFEVNPSTGSIAFPFTLQGVYGNLVFKRLQVRHADLDPALNPGASYFVEGIYVSADDAAAGNQNNNASYRPIQIIQLGEMFNVVMTGVTQQGRPAVQAWALDDPTVRLESVDVPADGRFWVASKATDLGGGVWRYEYAVENLNSHRAAMRFSVPLPLGAQVTNIGFHDVDYHSGEPFDGTDWSAAVDTSGVPHRVTWSTQSFADTPDANALRWGTLYNFRFDADVPPEQGQPVLHLFRPGDPAAVSARAYAPQRCDNDGACELGETCGNCPTDCPDGGGACCGDGSCEAGEDECLCPEDCGFGPSVELDCLDGVDEDCDGRSDCLDTDCCAEPGCAGADGDGDGLGPCEDCDDGNPDAWATPGEVLGMLLTRVDTGSATLSWNPPEQPGAFSVSYETLRSTTPSDFTAATCLETDDPTATTLELVDDPPSGILFAFLVRGANACPDGVGPLGAGLLPRHAVECP